MKKIFSYAGILAAAAMTLVGCAQEIDQPEQNGYAVEFTADLDVTKTVNDGLATKWSEGDKLNVFYAKAGTAEYSSNIKFTLSDAEEGRFTGVLDAPLGAETYDWFAQYPYSSYIKTPANTSTGYTVVGSKASSAQIQTAADSKAHIAGPDYPLFGRALAVPSNEAPSAVMHHGTSLLEVVVKNERAEAISVSSIAFTAPEDIVGTYYIDFTGEELVYTSSGANYVSNTATLSVEPAVEVAAGASSKFYLAVKPFTAPAESSLTLSVNNNAKNTVLAEAKTFEAGVTNTLNYTVSADDEIAEPVEIVATIAEFIAAADNYNIYILTGEITEVANTTYGNFYIKDETGELYIYGLCSPEGETKYWAESGLAVGDIVTVKGGYTLYGTTHEMVNAIYVSHTTPETPEQPEEEPGDDPVADPDAVTLAVTISDYVTENGCTVSAGSDVTNYKELALDDVITMTAIGTANNNGSFWSEGSQWRVYQNGGDGGVTVTAAEGYSVISVKFTYTINNSGVLMNGETQVKSDDVCSVNSSSITLMVGNTGNKTNGQVRITAVEVIYKAN